MGNTFEVSKWVQVDGEYQYLYEYRGENLLRAVAALLRARKDSGCVRFMWRG